MDYSLLEQMLLSRWFEQTLFNMFKEKRFSGTTHLALGQEACHVGLVAGLDKQDYLVPTHRCHGYNVARGTSIKAMFLELYGAKNGICGGLGGSMHMSDVATCNAGSSAVVGSGVGLATGLSFANQKLNDGNISVAIFGDGATSRGIVHECMNLASVWSLPLLFFCENNLYGMSASSSRMISTDSIYKRATEYNMVNFQIDGNDIKQVIETVKKARSIILNEKRPVFIEALTYRQCGHSKSDHLVYRSREEEAYWKAKDPILQYCKSENITLDTLNELKKKVEEFGQKELEAAIAEKNEILTEQDLSKLVFTSTLSQEVKLTKTHSGTYRESIYEGLKAVLAQDEKAYFLGEDIGQYGGCFGVSKDLFKFFPGRVIETPVSEEAFTELAVGAAFRGLHPIVEIMYGDFSTLASDALINHAAKSRFMSNGQLSVPLIYRAPIGSGTGHGAQHTQSLETMFLNIPGLIIVAPSDAWSAKAMLIASDKVKDPVLYFEHKALYSQLGEIPEDEVVWPLGKARVLKEGSSLTIVSYSHAVSTVLKSLEQQDYDVEVIDLCTIKPWDEECVLTSVKKTGRLLVVQDNPQSGSVGEMVISKVSTDKEGFKALKAVPTLLSGKNYPIPFSPKLEKSSVPSSEEILNAIASFFC